ncbi:MAG: hypothetical protein AOA65_0599 [Candidatus Bathyarchaeota archaeon BA1]|nr:MAG: hypothetical protein AOA65_0599 [Candidatus Bathyarchaeota archaeon BA1]
MPRPKDVHAGAIVIKTIRGRRYAYLAARAGRKVEYTYLGCLDNEDVLKKIIQFLRWKIEGKREELETLEMKLRMAEKDLERIQRLKKDIESVTKQTHAST